MKRQSGPQSDKTVPNPELLSVPVISSEESTHSVLNRLRSHLFESRDRVAELHKQGMTGINACAYQSAVMDEALLVLWQRYFMRNGIPGDIALFALGGYGRQELNPASDIDLLFVTRDGFPPPLEDAVTEMMQLLWDLHLDLGHSTRSIDECLETAEDDSHLATSVLEARFLTGDREVADEFTGRYNDMLIHGFGQRLAHVKITERQTRIAAYRDTVQIQEPNIKECPGTLRDIHLMRWLKTIRDLTGMPSHLPAHMHENCEAELSFLLRARNALHFVTGKKTDILSHLMLPDIACNLGYKGKGSVPVERFMHDYYRAAGSVKRTVDRIARWYNSHLDGDPAYCIVDRHNGVVIRDNEAGFTDNKHKPGPDAIMSLIMLAAERNLGIDPEAAVLIDDTILTFDITGVYETFHDLINMQHGTGRAVRLLHEYGMLNRIIPEFSDISWHYQYDFYHMFTTDEHSIRVVEHLERMAAGAPETDPELTVLMRDVTARGALYLAGILHDIGKAGGASHSQRGERLAVRALRRLGFEERTVDLVRFLIREHLLLTHISQRRDMEDEETISDVVTRVKSINRLRMLTLLTFADLMALSPGALTDWKRALLWELYRKTLHRLEGGYETMSRAMIKREIDSVVSKLAGTIAEETVRDHLNSLPEQYLRTVTPATIRRHIEGIGAMKKKGAWASFRRRDGLTALTVITRDHPRALADICGTITSADISILGAQIFTRSDGIIIDTFLVADSEGRGLIPADNQRDLKRTLPPIMNGDNAVPELIDRHARRWKRRRRKVVYSPPRVRFHNDISTRFTVIDVFATDYTGLLYDITSLLADSGIDIHNARIGTDEDQVADAFYVQRDGEKITDETVIERLSGKIIASLSQSSVV